MLVFVYGTLKRGRGNVRYYPKGSTYLYDGVAKGTMVSLGGFPGVLMNEEGVVHGEVWDVPDLYNLDMLEGEGRFYHRSLANISTGDGKQITAWMYRLPVDKYKDKPIVESGVW